MPYDKDTARRYSILHENPVKKYVVKPSLISALGDISGKSVLDIGCGDGKLTRAMKQRGAARVVGIDRSAPMIRLAREREKSDSLGIDYIVADARSLPALGVFDIAASVLVMHYSRTPEQLAAMSDSAYRNLLKPDGRFIAVNNILRGFLFNTEMYGIKREAKPPVMEGSRTRITYTSQSVSFTNYLWSRMMYGAVLKNSGFKSVVWLHLGVSQEGRESLGEDFWKDFWAFSPQFGLFEART